MSVITDGPARASAARSDTWTRTTRGLADACGLALMIFILATIALGELPLPVQRGAVLLLGAAAILFSTPTLPATWRSGRTGRLADRALTIVFLAAILAAMIYVFIDWFEMFSYRMGFQRTMVSFFLFPPPFRPLRSPPWTSRYTVIIKGTPHPLSLRLVHRSSCLALLPSSSCS